jgi:hypothetical protein
MPSARGQTPAGVSRRGNRDEAYVIDLCDETLGEVGRRQKRFEWLRGDAGVNGARDAAG